MSPSLLDRLHSLQEDMAAVASNSGRRPGSVKLVLVSKFIPAEAMLGAYQDGIRDFGENRVQEFKSKSIVLPADIRWHMIGTLQTNKVKDVAGRAALIHSLDRPELARALHLIAVKKKLSPIPCLVEVNMSGESSKSGFLPADLPSFLDACGSFSGIHLQGLMTIAPHTDDTERIRDAFRGLRLLRDSLGQSHPAFHLEELSMGMSADYRIAIEEGATLIRVGSLVFGPRPQKP